MKNTLSNTLKASLMCLSVGFILASCEANLDAPVASKGNVDFSKYVSLGNSLAAGYNDGALHLEGQLTVAYPNLLAEQFKAVGGGEFKQPLMPEGNGMGSGGNGRFKLVVKNGALSVEPTQGDLASMAYIGDKGPYNNMGVPGARSYHLLIPGYGSSAGNPFFARFASSPSTTILADAMAQKPSFYSLWIGNNDVLGYALAGGDGSGSASDSVTSVATFSASIDAIVAGMKSANSASKAVIATIPDVLKLPYFSTVPYNAFKLTESQALVLVATIKAQATPVVTAQVTAAVRAEVTKGVTAAVKAQTKAGAISLGMSEADAEAYATAYIASAEGKAIITAKTDEQMNTDAVKKTITDNVSKTLTAIVPALKAGENPFLIQDNSAPLKFRLMKSHEKIPISTLSYLSSAEFQQFPVIPANLVIDEKEAKKVNDAVIGYNAKLKAVAEANGYALADINTFFNSVQTGFYYQGVNYTTTFVSGGAFSLDGIHLTPRGAALIANEFIKAINAKYGSSVLYLDANSYKGVEFP